MNTEELKNQFEIAALGCLEIEQYRQFIQKLNSYEKLKKEFGEYQKVASLIPFSQNIQQPPIEAKNKVVLGIKKIILSRIKETKPIIQKDETEKTVKSKPENLVDKVEETEGSISEKLTEDSIPLSEEVISETNVNSTEEILSPDLTQNSVEIIESELKSTENPEVKVNIDYGPRLKEEIVEEVIRKIKKTINNQFEEFDYKINKKNRFIKVLLIILTLLTILLVASNIYQIFYSSGKKIEITKEIRTPVLEYPGSLQ